jgi:hypothetical protein
VATENFVRSDRTLQVCYWTRDGCVPNWFLFVLRSRFKSRARLEAENIVLRQQVIVLSRKSSARARLRNTDRLLFVWL